MVADVIKRKQAELLELLNLTNNNISKELLAQFESFSNRLLENPDELNKINIEEYVNEVYKNREDINKEGVIKTLNALKSFIDLKENNEPGLFELNANQVQLINLFGNDIKEFVNNIKENRKQQEKIREEHNKYNVVLDKIVNDIKLSKEDLSIITGLVPEDDKKTKIELLKEVIEYNLSLEKQKRKTNKQPIIDIETVIKELQKNEKNEKKQKQIEKQASRYKEELECNYELQKCEQLINYLKELGIYNKFDCIEDLMAVLIYGDLDSVKTSYEDFKAADFLNKDFIYSFPGLWTKQKNIVRKHKTNTNVDVDEDDENTNSKRLDENASLIDKVSVLNRESLYRKIKIYQENGIDPFEDEDKCITLFIASEDTIKRNIELFKTYNIKPSAGIMMGGNISERCDQLIECKLLNPNIDIERLSQYNQEEIRNAYVNLKSTFLIKFQPGHVFVISDLLEQGKDINIDNQSEILDPIFTKQNYSDNIPRLSSQFSKYFFGYDIENTRSKKETYKERCNEFLKQKELVTTNNELLKDFDKMKKISKSYERVEYKQETINSNFIKTLDELYKKEDYYYEIEGRRISRRKVLRLYEALQEYNKEYPDKAFDEERMETFAITYGTYFRLETLYSIITIVQELQRGENINEVSNRL